MAGEVTYPMKLTPYRDALALPGIRPLMLLALLVRVPKTMTLLALTLYVVEHLGHGYAAAGLAGAAMTVGSALGAPVLGRLVDRRGLRPVLVLTTVAEAAFWFSSPLMSYPVLLGGALLGGLLTLPVFSVIRQSIAALVPAERRRPAYALDSMSVELSFMVGPAVAVLLATSVSPRATLLVVGAGIVFSGLALVWLDPPTRDDREPVAPGEPPSRREWLTPRLVGMLAITTAATLVLGGTDVAVVAVLRAADQVHWTGVVLGVWAVYSLVGGFMYGMVTRPLPPLVIVLLLGICTIPVGLGGAQWWTLGLALLPAGVLCAPALAATSNAVSQLAPSGARGEAMGLQNSALTVGLALGAPLAGAVIDASEPAWGFAATGLVGTLLGLAVLPVELRRRRAAVGAGPTAPHADRAPHADPAPPPALRTPAGP
ncbi:MFS transporter [Plantactinospora sp. KLBMP9567]|uniref:MFS transporter n=1 Tax=Plantactinospora sp. KLBMP9567 TaxID=3085900 RepID=UPI0029812A57|nr:MFS transporter [Plantactinospora sp. KLBMP9567]MDW5329776.1 MFS transporter [Plantactinospora sp. KLBMP9567]